MPKYMIEPNLPGAGKLSAADLQAIAQRSISSVAPTPRNTARTLSSTVSDLLLPCLKGC